MHYSSFREKYKGTIRVLKKHTSMFVLLSFFAMAVVILVLAIIVGDIGYKGTQIFYGQVPESISRHDFERIEKEIRQPKLLYKEAFEAEILSLLDAEGKAKIVKLYKEDYEEYFGGLYYKETYVLSEMLDDSSYIELEKLLRSINYNEEILLVLKRVYVYLEGSEDYIYRDELLDYLSSYGRFVGGKYELDDEWLKELYSKYVGTLGRAALLDKEEYVKRLFRYIKGYNGLVEGERGHVREEEHEILKLGFRKIEFQYTPLEKFIGTSPGGGLSKGGIFSAIFGTVALVILMSFAVIPIGVITALYLNEYAKENIFTRMVRLAIHNLAGVPAIVFGLFGLGFFIQFVGVGIDNIFYDGELVYGQPAIIWAALVLALLTLPVVIVSTEEALKSIPEDIRNGSYALGATKFQTITKLVIPNALAGILTGAVLSVSRGVGEVAPILFTGAAYYLAELPTELNNQFMELGYHIYILATQSPDVEAAKPVLYATVFVLLVLTFLLNFLAIVVRRRIRTKFSKYKF